MLGISLFYWPLCYNVACVFLSRWVEESCECPLFRTKSQRNFSWFSGEKAQWSFLPVPTRLYLLNPTHQECSVVACNGVPGDALAVQSDSWFYDTGLSKKVSHFSLGELFFLLGYSMYPTCETKHRLVLKGTSYRNQGRPVATDSLLVFTPPLQVTRCFSSRVACLYFNKCTVSSVCSIFPYIADF